MQYKSDAIDWPKSAVCWYGIMLKLTYMIRVYIVKNKKQLFEYLRYTKNYIVFGKNMIHILCVLRCTCTVLCTFDFFYFYSFIIIYYYYFSLNFMISTFSVGLLCGHNCGMHVHTNTQQCTISVRVPVGNEST